MRTLSAVTALLAFGAGAASAQLPQASAATLDRGYDPTAIGGGFAAIASNPAGLARPDAPGLWMALPSVSARAGVGPVGLEDLAQWEGQLLPSSVKDSWMASIVEAGGQTSRGGVGATPLAITIGNVGLQVSARAAGLADLSEDAAELFLYGNAGRTGTPRDLDLENSSLDGFVLGTTALSFGMEVTDGLYMGVTGKYSVGLGLALGRDFGSVATADPIAVDVDFPILIPRTDGYDTDQGHGFGMDLGAIIEGEPFTIGVTIENVFNTFAWDLRGYSYVPGQAIYNEDDSGSDFDEVPLATAPQALQDYFEALAEDFKPETRAAVGISMLALPSMRLFANVQKSLSDGMAFDPDFYGGVGAEWTGISFFHLRGHGAVITDGYELGGGASLVLGPVHLTGGAAMRSESSHDSILATFALSFGSH